MNSRTLISVKCAECDRQRRKRINGLVDDIQVRESSVNGKSKSMEDKTSYIVRIFPSIKYCLI